MVLSSIVSTHRNCAQYVANASGVCLFATSEHQNKAHSPILYTEFQLVHSLLAVDNFYLCVRSGLIKTELRRHQLI